MTSAPKLVLDSHDKVLEQFLQNLAAFSGHGRLVCEVSLSALISGGHVLFEDVPGVGKTTFIRAIAQACGFQASRIQFTSDLMPADIIGVEVFSNDKDAFRFHPGPLFSQIVIADEINRANPRTQSALLESMGEGRVSVGNSTYELPAPFVVFASQNPVEQKGTFALPESQIDRFAACISLGYPHEEREKEILASGSREPLSDFKSDHQVKAALVHAIQKVDQLHVSETIVDKVFRVMSLSRSSDFRTRSDFRPLSTRAGVSWLRMAKGRAVLLGRDFVIPDDLKCFLVPCLSHRMFSARKVHEDILQKLSHEISV